MLTFFLFKEDTYMAIARQVLGDYLEGFNRASLFSSTKCVSTKSTELNWPFAKTPETMGLFLHSKIVFVYLIERMRKTEYQQINFS